MCAPVVTVPLHGALSKPTPLTITSRTRLFGAVFGTTASALVYEKAFASVCEPPALVTTSETLLAGACLGVRAVNAVLLNGVISSSGVPPSVAVISPGLIGNAVPVTVIRLPPSAEPAFGVIPAAFWIVVTLYGLLMTRSDDPGAVSSSVMPL